MCLIVIKPSGIPMPTQTRLEQWFTGHPDGFGLAFPYKGKARILKGALTKEAMAILVGKMEYIFKKQGQDIKEVNILFHFRLATHGVISQQNCHPFPLTKNAKALNALDIMTPCAIAHNGIITGNYYNYTAPTVPLPAEAKTDTQEFIEDYLVKLDEMGLLANETILRLVTMAADSRFALLYPDHYVLLGDFITDEGLLFSNYGYKNYPVNPTVWQDDYDYWWGDERVGGRTKDLCSLCGQPSFKLTELADGELVCPDCVKYFEEPKKREEPPYPCWRPALPFRDFCLQHHAIGNYDKCEKCFDQYKLLDYIE